MGFFGGVAGGTLGYLLGDIPGAALGYKLGSSVGNNLPKKKLMDSGYGSRKRRTSVLLGPYSGKRNKIGHVAIGGKEVGRVSRADFLKRLGVKPGGGRVTKKTAGQRRTVKAVRRKSTPHSNHGVYTGKTGKSKKNKRTWESKFLSQGALTTVEQYGTVTDPDCVYLAHSTGHILQLCWAIQYAILRKIMNKAGFKITNQNIEVPVSVPLEGLNVADNSAGLKFLFTCKNRALLTYRNYDFDTVDGQSFSDMNRLWVEMRDRFIDFVRGTEVWEPYKVAVYKRDTTALGTDWILGAEMYLEDCHIDLSMISTLTIQNRTLAAEATIGTSNDQINVDRIDAQPLKGYVYEFKHADPRVKHSALGMSSVPVASRNNLFESMHDIGMRLIRGNQFLGAVTNLVPTPANPAVLVDTSFGGAIEPLEPKYFANCDKSHKVIMQPGEMKKVNFKWDLKGKIVNVFKKLKVTVWDGPSFAFNGMVGRAQMISLEEMMRTPSTNKVTIAYERELKIGCIVKAAFKQAPVETIVVAEQYNNP